MPRTRKPVGSPDDGAMMELEPASYTVTYDWIRLAVSPMADSLYGKIRMHFNSNRGVAYPGKERLALLMRVARGDYIQPWLQELVDIGAIQILPPEGRRTHNVYRIRETPPPGYTGPVNLDQWSKENKSVVEYRCKVAADKTRLQRKRDVFYLNATPPAKLPAWFTTHFEVPATPEEWAREHEAEKARRADLAAIRAERAAAKATAAKVPGQRKGAKAQVGAVTVDNRLQEPSKIHSFVTGDDRLQVPDEIGSHVTDEFGLELDLVELDLVEPKTPLPPAKRARSATRPARATTTNRGDGSPKPDNQEPPPNPEEVRLQAQQELLVDELRPIMAARPKGKPRWREDATRDVLNELRGQAPFGQIRLMMLHLANGTFGFTGHPNRALQQTGPWWEQAQTEYRKSPESWSSTPAEPCPNRCDHGWLVDPATRLPVEPAVKCSHKAMAVVS